MRFASANRIDFIVGGDHGQASVHIFGAERVVDDILVALFIVVEDAVVAEAAWAGRGAWCRCAGSAWARSWVDLVRDQVAVTVAAILRAGGAAPCNERPVAFGITRDGAFDAVVVDELTVTVKRAAGVEVDGKLPSVVTGCGGSKRW